jgi:hypothetical protein
VALTLFSSPLPYSFNSDAHVTSYSPGGSYLQREKGRPDLHDGNTASARRRVLVVWTAMILNVLAEFGPPSKATSQCLRCKHLICSSFSRHERVFCVVLSRPSAYNSSGKLLCSMYMEGMRNTCTMSFALQHEQFTTLLPPTTQGEHGRSYLCCSYRPSLLTPGQFANPPVPPYSYSIPTHVSQRQQLHQTVSYHSIP